MARRMVWLAAALVLLAACSKAAGDEGGGEPASAGGTPAVAASTGPSGSTSEPSPQLTADDSPLTGTWAGTWENDNGLASGEYTLELVQDGRSFSGTISVSGKTCVRHGKVEGTISRGGAVRWGVVDAEEPIDFVTVYDEDAQTMSGTWTATACGPPFGPPGGPYTVTGTSEAHKIG